MSTYNELKMLQNKALNTKQGKQLSTEKLANLTLLNTAVNMTEDQKKSGFGKIISNEASKFAHAMNALGNNPILQNAFGNDLNGASILASKLKDRHDEKVFEMVLDNALLQNKSTNFLKHVQHENKDQNGNVMKDISSNIITVQNKVKRGETVFVNEFKIADPYKLGSINIPEFKPFTIENAINELPDTRMRE